MTHRLFHYAHATYIDHDPTRTDYEEGTEYECYMAPATSGGPEFEIWRKQRWRIHYVT